MRSARRFVAARDRGLPRRTLRARRKTAISALRRAAAGRAESARLEGVWAEREAAYYAQTEEDVVPY